MASCEGSTAHDVTLEDGSVVQYTLCGLTDQQVEPWAAFCASCFAYKANPPPASYFERHYYNDPGRDPSLIRVALCDGTIVSSVRIFSRQVSVGNNVCNAGGIGEVCTSSNHRRRGLSKFLLQDAIQIMTRRGFKLSLLHAAPAFFPVYQKVGYASVTQKWSIVTIQLSKCVVADDATMRLAEFPADTNRLQAMHQVYSERRFSGCIVRTAQYWNEYLCRELEGRLWVLLRDSCIVAWLSVRQKGHLYHLAEFGCDPSLISPADAMSSLLPQAIGENEQTIELRIPTLVLEDARQATFVDWTSAKLDNDDGWMYKTLQHNDTTSMVADSNPHLIWPADSF